MSLQEVCEVGGDLQWMSPRHAYSPTNLPSLNTITNTTTTARPLPDPTHCVQQLRALLSSRPDIGFLRTDSDFLLRFLKVRNFQVAAAFQLLCGYYCYRQRERELFKTTLGGAGVRAALLDGVVGVLPERDSSGSAILVILASNCDDTKCSLLDVWGAVLLSLEKLSSRGEEAGIVCVLDWSECPARLNSDLSHKALKLVLDGLQDAFPLRLSGLHLLNVPWWSGTILRLARPFIKEKTRGRTHVHGNNLSSLHRHLPPRLLPAQLGGEGGEYQPAAWASSVLDMHPAKNANSAAHSCRANAVVDSGKLLNSTAVRTPEIKKKSSSVQAIENKDNNNCDSEKYDDVKQPQSKGFTLESLIRSGSKKFQLAQMTEDSDGFTLKKIKSTSFDHLSNLLKSKDSSIFNFSKSKSLSVSSQPDDCINSEDQEDDEEEEESVYNFPKPKTPTSFTTTFTNSISNNMSRMGFNMRSKDGDTSYDKGQPSSHLLLAGDATAAAT